MRDRARLILAGSLACSAVLLLVFGSWAPLRDGVAAIRAEHDSTPRRTAPQPSEPVPAPTATGVRPAAQSSFEEVAAAFSRPVAATTAMPKRPAPATKAPWLHPIGSVQDAEGARWLFFKDDHSGRILKLRADGGASGTSRLIASGPEGYTIESDGQRFVAGGK